MHWPARSILIACLVACVAVSTQTRDAKAAEFPTRPLRLVVPYSAGGPTDILARVVADFLAKDLKQATFVENKPGAQGAIGAESVARSDPDGYTLLVVSGSMFVLNPMLYKKLAYDPDRDFRTLAIVTEDPLVMEVHPSVPAKSVAEFVAYAKQNPGKLNFGSAGTGGTTHLAGEMFKLMAGVDMVHVAYKGAGPALQDLLSGNIQLMFDSFGTALPPVKGGLLRPLASVRRSGIPNCLMCRPWPKAAIPNTRQRLVRRGRAGKVPDDVDAESEGQPRPRFERRRVPRRARQGRLSAAAPEEPPRSTNSSSRPRPVVGVIKALNISLD